MFCISLLRLLSQYKMDSSGHERKEKQVVFGGVSSILPEEFLRDKLLNNGRKRSIPSSIDLTYPKP